MSSLRHLDGFLAIFFPTTGCLDTLRRPSVAESAASCAFATRASCRVAVRSAGHRVTPRTRLHGPLWASKRSLWAHGRRYVTPTPATYKYAMLAAGPFLCIRLVRGLCWPLKLILLHSLGPIPHPRSKTNRAFYGQGLIGPPRSKRGLDSQCVVFADECWVY